MTQGNLKVLPVDCYGRWNNVTAGETFLMLKLQLMLRNVVSQSVFTGSTLTIETLKQGVKYVQSKQ